MKVIFILLIYWGPPLGVSIERFDNRQECLSVRAHLLDKPPQQTFNYHPTEQTPTKVGKCEQVAWQITQSEYQP